MKRLFLLLMTVIIISASANAMGEREWKHRNKGMETPSRQRTPLRTL